MKLDMEERLLGAFSELLLADTDIAGVVGDRVWWYGDASHRATYPCILLNLPDATVSGIMELGWYEMHLQILASVYQPDDKSLSTLRALEGMIRGFCQQTDLPSQLTGTTYARKWTHPLTVVDARIENDVADEQGQQGQIYAGTTLVVVCAPHNADAIRPSPTEGTTETGSGAGGDEPIENTQPTNTGD